MQDGVDELKVGHAHVAALARKAVFDPTILGFGDFHPFFIAKIPTNVN